MTDRKHPSLGYVRQYSLILFVNEEIEGIVIVDLGDGS